MAKSGFLQKAFSAIGLEPTDMDENAYYEDEKDYEDAYRDIADDEYEDQSNYRTSYRESEMGSARQERESSSRRSKIIQMPDNYRGDNSRMRMVIYRPTNFEETQSLINNLKSRRPVVMNLDEVDVRLAQRMLDFISGSVYTIGGEIKKVARNIFVVCPSNIDLTTDLEDEDEYRENIM